MFLFAYLNQRVVYEVNCSKSPNLKERMAAENGSQIVTEKLDKTDFLTWKFRMSNFLMGKGYWEYIEGNLEETPKILEENAIVAQIRAYKVWNQGARKVLHWLSLLSISHSMLGIYKMLYSQRKLATVW